jgi:beta-xylosidase
VTYVYATTSFKKLPVVPITDLDRTYSQDDLYRMTLDAMPDQPSWAASPEIWAPTVAKMGSQYVMFFAAHRGGAPSPADDQCVGRALATSPTGPFVPQGIPVSCGVDGVHGALDPSLFIGPDGSAHLLVAMGGSATNIWTYPLDGNGNVTGPAVALLTRSQPWENTFEENPSMIYDGSAYLLAYSNGDWQQESYNTGIARCASPNGPCTSRPDGPWLATTGDRSGPGGLSFFVGADGQARVAFESYHTGDVGPVGKRSTTIAPFFTDPWPRLG